MNDEATYQSTLNYIFEKLPMFSRVGVAAYKADLDNIIALCERIGNPQLKFKTTHVAGTNGKGSCSHMLAAVMQTAGYKTGLYTSPHIADFRERIRINGIMISQDEVVRFVDKIKPIIEEINPSFFEITVAMAFDYFASQNIDIAVIEVGLGGLLDSTNIIMPEVSLITNISLDHTNLLGNTLKEIASQKAGIIKPNVPVVIGETQAKVESVFFAKSILSKSPIFFADQVYQLVNSSHYDDKLHLRFLKLSNQRLVEIDCDLQGDYQVQNVRSVWVVCDVLQSLGWRIEDSHRLKALKQIGVLTGLKGRFDIIHQKPMVIADVSHNKAGLQKVFAQIAQLNYTKLFIVLGFVNDKKLDEVFHLMPLDATYLCTQAQIERALPYNELLALCVQHGLNSLPYASVAEALSYAWDQAHEDDLILITGSFFIMDEAYTCINTLTKTA